MEPVSRRIFMKRAGGVAASVGALAVAPVSFASGASAATAHHEAELTSSEDLAPGEHLVARVADARRGEIVLFVGHRQVTLYDRRVAARLVRASR